VEDARQANNYPTTGLANYGSFVVIHEDMFYKWICGLKDSEHILTKSSLFEKFDKSRRTNRVNPKDKTGRIMIKYLRIDRSSRNAAEFMGILYLQKAMDDVEQAYGTSHIRVITHRDWGYLSDDFFIYEVKRKKD